MSFLTQPFPFTSEIRKRTLTAIYISVFVFLFLFLFRPFGLGYLDHKILPITLGYGAVTLLVCLLINVLLPKLLPSVFNEEHWVVYKEMVFTLIVILFVALGNLLYSNAAGISPMSLYAFLNFGFLTILVGVIPVAAMILIKQNILLERNLGAATKLSNELYHKKRLDVSVRQITIGDNPKDQFTIEAGSIYYIKAAENYVEIFYDSNGRTEKKLLRTTMKNAHSSLKSLSQFYRCHRTYLVNLEKVKKVTGNAQGYRLIVENVEEAIPVSRSLNKEIALRLGR